MATKNVKSAFLSTRTSVTPHFMSYHTARDEISELISREHGVHVSYIQPKTVATERSFHGRTCSAFALRRIADKTSPEIRPKACGVIFCVQFVRHYTCSAAAQVSPVQQYEYQHARKQVSYYTHARVCTTPYTHCSTDTRHTSILHTLSAWPGSRRRCTDRHEIFSTHFPPEAPTGTYVILLLYRVKGTHTIITTPLVLDGKQWCRGAGETYASHVPQRGMEQHNRKQKKKPSYRFAAVLLCYARI